ncbi:MAG: hypothetical protein AB8H03_00695 [Saprospiraceae bacterium]
MNNTPLFRSMGFSQKLFYFFFIVLVSTSISFQSCNPAKGMVTQDLTSLEGFMSLKTDAVSLMKKGAKSFSSMAPQINEYKAKMNDQIDYEKAKGEKNIKTVQMLEILSNPEGNLLGGFFKRWENEGKLNAPFIKEIAGVVSKNFDKVINLEKKKKKPKM